MRRTAPRGITPVAPGPGQESAWDYPRPPALQISPRRVVVRLGGALVAESSSAWRVMETSHPPTWYLPTADVLPGRLRPSRRRATVCEWKGAATYWDVVGGPVGAEVLAPGACWSYERPTERFLAITGFVSFMPGELECTVDGERVRPQAGGFYGGWITDDVVGPFKGEPGTLGW